jgi:general secretion pathway protein A
MYESHFGLSVSPFAMSPDPRFLYFTPSHREALAGLMYGILNRKGFVALIGDAGTGKTSLLQRVLQAVSGNKSLIVNPCVTAAEFTKLAMMNFGIEKIPADRVEQLEQFEKFLRKSKEEGKLCVLVVDEAQRLSPSVLEEIRMLTNFELPEGKLLQIVLAGQSELRGLLNRPDLWQLKQRIAMRLTLKPLSGTAEITTYMRHRWVTAGGSDTLPFSADAIELIVRWSTGIPRIVNVLCDNALLLAFAEGTQQVTSDQVKAAAAELDLVDAPTPAAPNGVPAPNGLPAPNSLPAPNGVPASNGLKVSNGASSHPAPPKPLAGLPEPGPVRVSPTLERYQPARARRWGLWRLFAK